MQAEVEVQEIFDRAYHLVRDNEIAHGCYAHDHNGVACYTEYPGATGFDSIGAIFRACADLGLIAIIHNDQYRKAVKQFVEHVQMNYECWSLHDWNDSAEDDDVREMFRRIASPLCE